LFNHNLSAADFGFASDPLRMKEGGGTTMRWVSLGPVLFWTVAGVGTIALAMLSAQQAQEMESQRLSVSQGGGGGGAAGSASASDPSHVSKLAQMFGGYAPAEGKDGPGRNRGCSGDCSVGGLGRKWAALRDYHDAADCDGASSSVDFEQGCRAYTQERGTGGAAAKRTPAR
jgi:hypothetical protein